MRTWGLTTFCGIEEHDKCRGDRFSFGERVGPCTCLCHGDQRAEEREDLASKLEMEWHALLELVAVVPNKPGHPSAKCRCWYCRIAEDFEVVV